MLFRVIRLYDIKNDQRESSAALVGTVSQTVRSGSGPYKEKYHARPALHTVFSITQSDLSISHCNSCHHDFGNAFRVTGRFDKPGLT